MNLTKVIKLFESKQTAQLSDRHASGIMQLCKELNNEDQQVGFHYKDLLQVSRVVDLCYQSVEKGQVSNVRI
jgi:hypothetical protein